MISITARNFKLTEGIKNCVFDRLGKFGKFLPEGDLINVVLESNKYGKEIEVSFRIQGKPLRASCIDNDLYVAIDLIVDKIDKLIKRNSDKINENNGDSIRFAKYPSLSEMYQENFDKNPKIVKRKSALAKPMLEEEAIAQMELLNHKSFIFYNASTDIISMLYKRNDGDYGIIEME